MRLVADESCDFSVVLGVRGAGHDVIAIAELMSGVDDSKVIELAASERPFPRPSPRTAKVADILPAQPVY